MPKRKVSIQSAWTKLIMQSLAPPRRARRASRIAPFSLARPKRPAGEGDWIAGIAMGATGARRYRLYRPPGITLWEKLPLVVMLHGCGQDASTFATSTRMNRIARQHRFLVLYPEQDRISNVQGCWNWYQTGNGRANGEAALIMQAVDQVCMLYGADRDRVAVAGLSAGGSMAALLATREPGRFKAVIMHSGVPPGTASSTVSAMQAMRGRRATATLAATPEGEPTSRPPLMVIHGGRDHVVASSNGLAAVTAWADAAQARAGSRRTLQRGKRYPMDVTEFTRGRSVVATLVEVPDLAHAWSGGAKGAYSDEMGPDASRLAWAFAAKQFAGESTG